MNDTYLERVALCRVPGRERTLQKRLDALKAEDHAIRAELARLRKLQAALRKGAA
jgi:cell division protein FtsB